MSKSDGPTPDGGIVAGDGWVMPNDSLHLILCNYDSILATGNQRTFPAL